MIAIYQLIIQCYNFANMKITKQLSNKQLSLLIEGELNTSTAPEFEEVIKNDLANVESLTVDLEKLSYLSSAGLRVLLVAQKIMVKKGGMVVRHPNKEVMEIFSLTGFSNVLDIEN